MLLSIKQLAVLLRYNSSSTYRLLSRLNIPLIRHNKPNRLYLDTSTDHPFSQSIRLHHNNRELQILYSIRDLARLFHRSKNTVMSIIREADIPTHGRRKKFLYLSELTQFGDQMRKISSK